MAALQRVTIHIDGAARGNPGPSAYAFVISQEGGHIVEEAGRIADTTNNVAEYTALVQALHKAADLKAHEVLIKSDSELLVRQMRGEYKVKNEKLRHLWQEATQLAAQFRAVRYTHVPREENKEADRLCNEALDGADGKKNTRKKPSENVPLCLDDAKDMAEAILQAAGRTWIKKGRLDPPARDILEEILSLYDKQKGVR